MSTPAFNAYRSLPVPSRSVHAWRYTPWKKIHPTGEPDVIPSDLIAATATISMLDGTDVPVGVSLEMRESVLRDSPLPDDDIAVAFLREVCNEHWHLKVESNIVLKSPLLVEIRAGGHLAAIETSVDIGAHSVVESVWTISGEASWFGFLRQGSIAVGAEYYEVMEQALASSTVFLRGEGWDVGRDATMNSCILSLGGSLLRSDIRSRIVQGSTIKQLIASYGIGDRSDDHHLEIDHVFGNNVSRVVLHSACDDSSRAVSTGQLRIAKGANGSNASQIFRNLLLSPDARAESIPELEVLADDVSAAHGAASAPIDPEQLFYLESRGLDPDAAQHLVVEGFLIAAMQELGSGKLFDWLRGRLTIHLDCALLE
ncbi:MAG: SufD family Fe-S cluster assembly protein [Candidatus Poseidoniaceae archaeon]|nr:SufD family Fe-S cluster assembly protein [Candidatus Poseidoniaceae archaeon]